MAGPEFFVETDAYVSVRQKAFGLSTREERLVSDSNTKLCDQKHKCEQKRAKGQRRQATEHA